MEAGRPLSVVSTPNPKNRPTGNLREDIRRRAYELYEQRGKNDGHDVDDWLRAESELTRQEKRPIAA